MEKASRKAENENSQIIFQRHIILTSLYILLFVKVSYQVRLECIFQDRTTVYLCEAKNLTTSWNDRIVTDVIGDHFNEKNNVDVQALMIEGQNCHFIPSNLSHHFPNLEYLMVRKSNVQFIITGDLDGLDKLAYFDVANNPIDHIGEDFFKGHSSLKYISFSDCHIKKVDYGAFDDLKNLTYIDFEKNECIDTYEATGNRKTIEKIINMIYTKCHGAGNAIKTINFKECARKHAKLGSSSGYQQNGFSENYVLLPLGILSLLLTAMLSFTIFRVYRRKNEQKFNEVINDGFAELEDN